MPLVRTQRRSRFPSRGRGGAAIRRRFLTACSARGPESAGAVPSPALGPCRLPINAGPVGMRTRMPTVGVDGFGAGGGAAGGAVPLPGRLPLGAGPVGMRTRMPLMRYRCGHGYRGRCRSAAGRSGCGCLRCGLVTGTGTGSAAARRRAGRGADADDAGADGRRRLRRVRRGRRRRGAVPGAGAGPVTDRRPAGRDADADAAGAVPLLAPDARPVAARRRAGRDADAGAGGAVSLRAPGPGRLPISAGPIGMRTRMPLVRYRCGHGYRGRCRSAPGRLGCGRGWRWCGAVAGADAGPVADRRRAGRDADADGASDQPRPSVPAHRYGQPLQRAAIRRRFLAACKVLGPTRLGRPTIHHGRHTFSSHALAREHTLEELPTAEGHSNLTAASAWACWRRHPCATPAGGLGETDHRPGL